MADRKFVWVQVEGYDRDFITGCLEAGVDGIYSREPIGGKVRELGVVTTITPDGELALDEDVTTVTIESKEDEERVLQEANRRYVVVKASDWMIIPLENLIAQTENLVAHVQSAEEARLALETMEKGVDGVLLDTRDLNQVRETVESIRDSGEHFDLKTAKISSIRQVGLGDRVCVDTSSLMELGQGMLVGNSSAGMFLVHAEVEESEYVASRPFRVNAGGVHAYIRVPGGKTRYLSELRTGDDVLLVDREGEGRTATVGRSKLERRPMMLVEAQIQEENEEYPVSLLLQNAETIKLTTPEGNPLSVVEAREGDEVLAYHEEAGRHFGMKIDETIQER